MNAVGLQVRSAVVTGCSWAVLCCLAVAVASGCKTGTSSMKPSWWSFGGSSTTDPALASAPAFEGDVKKPSDAAKPYPTTTTPNGYVLDDAAGKAAAGDAVQAQPEIPAAITYGSTPKPATVAAVSAATGSTPAVTDVPSARQPAAVAAQVGPYAGLTAEPETPPGFSPSAPGLTPVPQTAATATPPAYPAAPGSAFGSPPPSAPRDGTAWSPAAAAAATAPASASAISEGRYGSNSGSRFASLPPATGGLPVAAPSTVPSPSGPTTSAGLLPAGLDPLPAAAATAAAPSAGFSAPSASALPPSAGPAFTPAITPPSSTLPVAAPSASGLPPASPPPRRPDPGYRPGGTSSYRHSRAILADDPAMADPAVRPAGFETPVGPSPSAAGATSGFTSP